MIEEKIQQRLKNLLAMSKDKGSPNEAAIAQKRLDSMCEKHGITVESVERGDFRATSRLEPLTAGFPKGYGRGPFNDWVIFDEATHIVADEWLKHQSSKDFDNSVFEVFHATKAAGIDSTLEKQLRDILRETMSTMNDDMIRDLFKK